jgi:hypothetical protein
LREDQRIIRKNQVEDDLTKSLQAQKWKNAEQLAERLLTLETDEDSLRTVRTIRDNASAKRRAGVRVLWFWGIVIGGPLIWALANSGGTQPRTSDYRAPPPSYPTTTYPTTTPAAPPRNDAVVPVDTGETMPPVGTDVALTRSNIRYCSFQRVRLEAARPLIETNPEGQRFQAAISDYNSRCGDYRYRQSDEDAVDAELTGRRIALEAEGRSLAASWRSNYPSGQRSNR